MNYSVFLIILLAELSLKVIISTPISALFLGELCERREQ
jgi:hypothetical protein